ncbi:MAG: diguanylate cyclase [Actinomycetota bacterium]
MRDDVTVLLVGLENALGDELTAEDGFTVQRAEVLGELPERVDAVVVALAGTPPLELLGRLRAEAPDAAVIVVTEADHEADGSIAMHAGAEDHLVTGAIPTGLLPRAVRYAVAHRRLYRELATADPATGLLNLRGFAPIAEHHLKMADRAKLPVVFLFVRLEGVVAAMAAGEPEEADGMARDAAEVLLEAVRDSDVPSRIAADTFCVLLTGHAAGAETLVLSRLVEAIAVHDAKRENPRQLSLAVGSALYDPDHPDPLESILQTAGRRLTGHPESSDA